MESDIYAIINPSFSSQFKLLELDELLANDIINNKTKISLKGKQSDDAVICTKNETYSIRLVESSNTFLFVQNFEQT
jgi:sister chromatid cohesion protein DCC1